MTSSSTKDQPRLATEVAHLWPRQGQWTETDYFKLPDTNRTSLPVGQGKLG